MNISDLNRYSYFFLYFKLLLYSSRESIYLVIQRIFDPILYCHKLNIQHLFVYMLHIYLLFTFRAIKIDSSQNDFLVGPCALCRRSKAKRRDVLGVVYISS